MEAEQGSRAKGGQEVELMEPREYRAKDLRQKLAGKAKGKLEGRREVEVE